MDEFNEALLIAKPRRTLEALKINPDFDFIETTDYWIERFPELPKKIYLKDLYSD